MKRIKEGYFKMEGYYKTPSQAQILTLVTFMENHPRLVTGQLTETYGLLERERTWEELKNKLNSIDTPFKTRSEWKKVWNDKKCSVRNKAIMYKRRIKKNPEENNPKFTLIEKRIMKLIGFRQLSEVCPTINCNFRQNNTKSIFEEDEYRNISSISAKKMKTNEEMKNSGPKISFTKSLQSSMDKDQLNDSMETDSEQPVANGDDMSECITSDVPVLGDSPLSASGEIVRTKGRTNHTNTSENHVEIKQEPSDDFLYETSSSSISEIIKPIIVSVTPVSTPSLSTSLTSEIPLSSSMVIASPPRSKSSHCIELDPHNLIASTKDLQLEDCTDDDINLLLNDYIKAKKKENTVQDTPNVKSDSSDFDKNASSFKRARQKPLRYRDSSSDEEIFIVSKETGPQAKKQYIISTPSSSIRHSPEATETRDVLSNSANSELRSPQGLEDFTEDDASLRQMISRILNSLEEIKKDVAVIKKNQSEMSSQIVTVKMILGGSEPGEGKAILHLPEDVTLPVTSEADLEKLNARLSEDKSFAPILVKYLSNVSYGKTLSAYTSNLVRKLFVKDVACLYSRLGRKGKKSFESYKDLFNVIMTVVKVRFPNEKREDCAEKFGRVLAQAGDWDGARRQKNNTFHCFY